MPDLFPELTLERHAVEAWIIRCYPQIFLAPGTILADTPEVESKVREVGNLFTAVCTTAPDTLPALVLEPETLDHLLTGFAWLDLQRRTALVIFLEHLPDNMGERIISAMIDADPDHRGRTMRETISLIRRAETIERMTQPIRIAALTAATASQPLQDPYNHRTHP
ncbi:MULTISPECIES: hypothetical protein [Acidiphilium]|uniref:Uncharacterized protein n=1 Tax=Acidiphilium rubrum TaxID=526 RepID=A0A8G2CMS1_ACIRU|nr:MULTISPECIES: hypothetical protein [Acidiphilium]SIR29792.1 hypothetical protein SAMN05421828_12340 [Acidiphilium rubrum]